MSFEKRRLEIQFDFFFSFTFFITYMMVVCVLKHYAYDKNYFLHRNIDEKSCLVLLIDECNE